MGLLVFAVIYWVMIAVFVSTTSYLWLRDRLQRRKLRPLPVRSRK